jgi:hypothetical protein
MGRATLRGQQMVVDSGGAASPPSAGGMWEWTTARALGGFSLGLTRRLAAALRLVAAEV